MPDPRHSGPGVVPHPDDGIAAPSHWPPTDQPVPRGFQPVAPFALSGLRQLPCPVYLGTGRRPVLYAAAGADALAVAARALRGSQLLIRTEDADLFRRGLADRLPEVLADQTLSPAQRSRKAYAMATHVVGPLFVQGSRVDLAGVRLGQLVADAVALRLLDEEELVWAMVASMQRHLMTHTHALNTAVYATILAAALDLGGPDALRNIGCGALLHDLGKNRVPQEILDKPGPLDEDEWRVMRTHPEVGYELLVRAVGTAPSYAHIVLEHHERCDGSGYPGGRYGHQIALDSQVVAIADAFDALTSARPYKAAASPFDALRIMRFEMVGQFNDELLRVFIGLLGAQGRIRRGELRELRAGTGG